MLTALLRSSAQLSEIIEKRIGASISNYVRRVHAVLLNANN